MRIFPGRDHTVFEPGISAQRPLIPSSSMQPFENPGQSSLPAPRLFLEA
jgi:hypothetical protein